MQNNLKEKIKELRKEQNLTLEQLANIVGCSKSYISQLENGLEMPSISMLGKLSEGLNTNITNLFLNGEENRNQHTTRIKAPKLTKTSYFHLRKNRRRTVNYPDGKTISQFLTTAVYQKTMQPIYTTIEPGGGSNGDEMITHPENSEEFVWIVKGKVDFAVDTLLRGVFAGIFSAILKEDVDCVEVECTALNDNVCKFIVKPKKEFDLEKNIVREQLVFDD